MICNPQGCCINLNRYSFINHYKMNTKNIYNLPTRKKDIKYVIKDSPAHKIYNTDGKRYDATKAIDLTVKEDTELYSMLEGEVIFTFDGVNKTWNKESEPPKEFMKKKEWDGNYIVIKHPNKELTLYSHLKLNGIKVKKGDRVKAKQFIGDSGNTGWSMGPHVHIMPHDFPEENNGGYRSLEPTWKKGIKEFLDKKTISYKDVPKEFLK